MKLERRRHADARAQARRAGQGALRRRHARPKAAWARSATASRCASIKPLRRPQHDLRHVRESRRITNKRLEAPVSHHFGFMIESMVAILLLLTILYCVRLSKQLRLLRADEQSMRDHRRAHHRDRDRRARDRRPQVDDARRRAAAGATPGRRRQRVVRRSTRHLTAGRDLLAKLARITGAARSEPNLPKRPTRARSRRRRRLSPTGRARGVSGLAA